MPRVRLLRPALLWPALVLLCALLYLLGLGSPYAPTNGDEMVYVHIARMTSESGHWLPLQSELEGTRNTKPPLLIWQAMVAGGWGTHWNLLALRLPSVLYTFATTALLGIFCWRLSGKARTAWLAAAFYLLCFSSFRYGRVYLTSAPETFWLALPMGWLLWRSLRPVQQPAALPGLAAWTAVGLALGVGAAYKSFALLAPAAAAVWCALLLVQPRLSWRAVLGASAGAAWSVLLGLGIFALWFVLDPDPAAVWQEFVLAENAGKMSGSQGYWHAALYGAYPMWTQLLAYAVNAGLLFFVALGLCLLGVVRGVQRLRAAAQPLPPSWRILLAWLLVWLVVFTIPSQRSERYLIPAMPAFAICMALLWERVPRLWFALTLLVCAPALVVLARIGWVMGGMDVGSPLTAGACVLLAAAGLLAAGLGLARASLTRNATLVACLSVYATFGMVVAPLSGPQADYTEAVQAQMRGLRVAVPNGFTGQYERFHFVLPGARITPYDAEGRNTGALYPDMPAEQRLALLLSQFDAVVWLQDSLQQAGPSCLPACRVLGQRWHIKSRHQSGEVTLDNVWYPQQWLFRREWLVAAARP